MAQPSERCLTPSQLFPNVSTQEPLGDGEINHRVLLEEVGVQAAANALLQPALEAGGDDNVSVIVVGSRSNSWRFITDALTSPQCRKSIVATVSFGA